MINVLSIAVQGVGFTALSMAVNGLLTAAREETLVKAYSGGDGAGHTTTARKLPAWLDNRPKLGRILLEDQIASELLVSLITKGFFHHGPV